MHKSYICAQRKYYHNKSDLENESETIQVQNADCPTHFMGPEHKQVFFCRFFFPNFFVIQLGTSNGTAMEQFSGNRIGTFHTTKLFGTCDFLEAIF